MNLVRSFSEIGKYLNKRYNYVSQTVRGIVHETHKWLTEHRVYHKLGFHILTVLINGFVIWIGVIPVLGVTPLWWVPSYGIMPWFLIHFVRQLKEP